MRPLSLKMRISLALLVAFALVAGTATAFAKARFRETETLHAREDSAARVEAIARLVDTRFFELGQDANAAANDGGTHAPREILEAMQRSGFANAIVLGAQGGLLEASGEASANTTLVALMRTHAPAPDFPATTYAFRDGWLLVGSRSTDLKTAVVGAMSRDFLSDSFLVDALVHPTNAHAVLTREGEVVAASANYPADRAHVDVLESNTSGVLSSFDSHADAHFSDTRPLVTMDARVEGLTPGSGIAARVDAVTQQFLFSMGLAFGLGGIVTVGLVTLSFRPLDRITDAARRLGRGEEDIQIPVAGNDEIGTLASVMEQSAAFLAAARRAEADRAAQARLAAEDFELAVGALSRGVGEAETPEEVAARLADALLRVTSARAVVVRSGSETLAACGRDGDAPELHALLESDRDAFHTFTQRSGAHALEVAVLPGDAPIPASEARKVEILAAQAGLALHRARSTAEVRRAHAQKEVFLDILSHDLKNPIAVARGRVELLQRRQPEVAGALAPVEQSLDRATGIIEQALLLSRLDRAAAPERQPADVVAIAEESAQALRPLAAQRGIRIEVLADAPVTWPVNPLLQRAIENILSNAIKWSPQDKAVHIAVHADDARCTLRVVDHGPGIAPEDRTRVFGRFERADHTGVKGTGLGLAIARRVAQMHDASIRIEQTPGGGCTFVLDIPLPAPGANPPPLQGGAP